MTLLSFPVIAVPSIIVLAIAVMYLRSGIAKLTDLDDGRQLLASPGHPLADGRRLDELVTGCVSSAHMGHMMGN